MSCSFLFWQKKQRCRRRDTRNPERRRSCPATGCGASVVNLKTHHRQIHHNPSFPENFISVEDWDVMARESKAARLSHRRQSSNPGRDAGSGLTHWDARKLRQPDRYNCACPQCGRILADVTRHKCKSRSCHHTFDIINVKNHKYRANIDLYFHQK